MNSDTPRTECEAGYVDAKGNFVLSETHRDFVPYHRVQQLERELNAANAKLAKADELERWLDLLRNAVRHERHCGQHANCPLCERQHMAGIALTAYQQSTSTDEGKEK